MANVGVYNYVLLNCISETFDVKDGLLINSLQDKIKNPQFTFLNSFLISAKI